MVPLWRILYLVHLRRHLGSSFLGISASPSFGLRLPFSACAHLAMSGQQLKELNARSAAVGQDDVCVYRPRIHNYTYEAKTTKETMKGSKFCCILVSMKDREQYVVAELTKHGNDEKPIRAAERKFKEKLCFRISKTCLKADAKQEYLHTSQKLVVDIGWTKFDPLLQNGDAAQLSPAPSMTVAACVGYVQAQRFDVTALVAQIFPVRSGGGKRSVRDVILVDGSKLENGNLAELKLDFFFDSRETKEEKNILALLTDAAGKPIPLSFFAVQGKKVDTGYKFESSRDFFLVPASLTSGKGAQQVLAADALHATPPEDRETLETTFSPQNNDYANDLGTETFCALLRGLKGKANVKAIDDNPTLWQVNWAEVAWPTGPQLRTKDGARLWFKTAM
jgi:hypothetical protein